MTDLGSCTIETLYGEWFMHRFLSVVSFLQLKKTCILEVYNNLQNFQKFKNCYQHILILNNKGILYDIIYRQQKYFRCLQRKLFLFSFLKQFKTYIIVCICFVSVHAQKLENILQGCVCVYVCLYSFYRNKHENSIGLNTHCYKPEKYVDACKGKNHHWLSGQLYSSP